VNAIRKKLGDKDPKTRVFATRNIWYATPSEKFVGVIRCQMTDKVWQVDCRVGLEK
jgi:hypothetical protein